MTATYKRMQINVIDEKNDITLTPFGIVIGIGSKNEYMKIIKACHPSGFRSILAFSNHAV